MVQVTSPTSLAVESPQGKKLFVFDKVFGEDVDQEGVWGYLNESVNAFIHGYNVSLMAYGQSGAGKSYTMGTSGPAEQGDEQIMGKPLVDTYVFHLLPHCFVVLVRLLVARTKPSRYHTPCSGSLV